MKLIRWSSLFSLDVIESFFIKEEIIYNHVTSYFVRDYKTKKYFCPGKGSRGNTMLILWTTQVSYNLTFDRPTLWFSYIPWPTALYGKHCVTVSFLPLRSILLWQPNNYICMDGNPTTSTFIIWETSGSFLLVIRGNPYVLGQRWRKLTIFVDNVTYYPEWTIV